MQQIDLPVRGLTCPCFGGPDLKTLYVVANLRTGRAPEPHHRMRARPLASS